MVVASPNPLKRSKKTRAVGVPTIDLTLKNEQRSTLTGLIVEACQDFGIFKVVNHGVDNHTVSDLEKHGLDFFSTPPPDKYRLGPGKPFGYGSRNIGSNGDIGDLDYLLLPASNSSTYPPHLSNAVSEYVGEVQELACELLDLMAEGLCVSDKSILSKMIRDTQSDSLLRLNHYPPVKQGVHSATGDRIGFGEHSDPQILTIHRSNDVGGLQIRMPDGLWVPVQPDPNAFYVMVGDALQVLTNGRFVSVKHRAMANDSASKGRMSIMFFGAPPMNSMISPLEEMVSSVNPSLYMPFTWAEYKRAMRNSRLNECRLNLFKTRIDS